MKRTARYRPRRQSRLPLVVLGGAAVVGLGMGALSTRGTAGPVAAPSAYTDVATNCRVVDGDTLHCDGGRIRLLGIDAPELPGHCAAGRNCAPGNPYASTESLSEGLGNGREVRFQDLGTDRYGRTLALVMGRSEDLSCWQLEHGQAIYRPYWDNDGRVRAICPR